MRTEISVSRIVQQLSLVNSCYFIVAGPSHTHVYHVYLQENHERRKHRALSKLSICNHSPITLSRFSNTFSLVHPSTHTPVFLFVFYPSPLLSSLVSPIVKYPSSSLVLSPLKSGINSVFELYHHPRSDKHIFIIGHIRPRSSGHDSETFHYGYIQL